MKVRKRIGMPMNIFKLKIRYAFQLFAITGIVFAFTSIHSRETKQVVPKVVGEKRLVAYSRLSDAGIDFQVIYSKNVCVEQGNDTVYHVEPSEGEPLNPENPLVIIKIVTNTTAVRVPDILNIQPSHARKMITALGLIFKEGRPRPSQRKGDWCGFYVDIKNTPFFHEQEPAKGVLACKGDTITGYRLWSGRWVSQRSPDGRLCK